MEQDLEMNKDEAKMLCRIFSWAWSNDIEILLYSRRDYSGHRSPILRFTKGNSSIEKSYYRLTDMTALLEHEWREIGFKLCVAPLEDK